MVRLRKKDHAQASSGKSARNSGGGKQYRGRGKQVIHANGSPEVKEGGAPSGARDKTKVKCFNCGIFDHYAKECREPRSERKEQVKLAQVQDEEPMLLMAQACALTEATDGGTDEIVLNEVHAEVHLGREEENHDNA